MKSQSLKNAESLHTDQHDSNFPPVVNSSSPTFKTSKNAIKSNFFLKLSAMNNKTFFVNEGEISRVLCKTVIS